MFHARRKLKLLFTLIYMGLVTHTGSLALRARVRADMQMCSVGAIFNKAGVFALFCEPRVPISPLRLTVTLPAAAV